MLVGEMRSVSCSFHFFFLNATATSKIYTLSLHDALPICTLTPHVESGEEQFLVERLADGSVWYEVAAFSRPRSEEHTSELQSQFYLVCRLLLEKKKTSPAFMNSGETCIDSYPGTP